MSSLVARGASVLSRAGTTGTQWAVAVPAALAVAVSVPALVAAPERVTTYAGASAGLLTVSIAAAVALTVAGSLAWADPASRGLAGPTLVAAMAWVAPVWDGWVAGPPLLRSLGGLLAPLGIAAMAQLAMPGGRRGAAPAAARVLVGMLWWGTAAFTAFRAAVRDPALDPHCWSNCTVDVFLVRPLPTVAADLDTGWRSLVVVVAGATAAAVLTGARTRRRPVALAASAALGAQAWYALLQLLKPEENPVIPPFAAVNVILGTSLVLVGASVGRAVRQVRLGRAVVGRIAAELLRAAEPGSLEDVLRREVGDDDLQVAYWRASQGQHVDPRGRPWTAPPGAALALTRDGQPLAVVVRPGRVSPPGDLLEHLGPAARLAIDNERLGAEALAELADLRASRMRIVDSADEARIRLERDLHDGAQQRLLALASELRLARSEARPGSAQVLADLADEVAATIEDVRDLAHGIFPAELEESGLEAALELLADSAPVPVRIDVAGDPPVPVARAAYLVVRSAIEAAHEGPVRVTVRCAGATVRLEVDGTVPPDLEYCADRVGALGGTLTAGLRRLTVEVPCA